jgi:hypothetical protein
MFGDLPFRFHVASLVVFLSFGNKINIALRGIVGQSSSEAACYGFLPGPRLELQTPAVKDHKLIETVSIVRFELAFLGPLEQLTQLLLLCRLQSQVAKSQKRIIGKRFDGGIGDGLADPVPNHIFQRAVRGIRKGPGLSGQLVGKQESQDFTHGSSAPALSALFNQ